jgi:hypothetical protein
VDFYCPRAVFNPRSLGPVVCMLAITPLRMTKTFGNKDGECLYPVRMNLEMEGNKNMSHNLDL